jgi:ribosomal protein S19E (S16A)
MYRFNAIITKIAVNYSVGIDNLVLNYGQVKDMEYL